MNRPFHSRYPSLDELSVRGIGYHKNIDTWNTLCASTEESSKPMQKHAFHRWKASSAKISCFSPDHHPAKQIYVLPTSWRNNHYKRCSVYSNRNAWVKVCLSLTWTPRYLRLPAYPRIPLPPLTRIVQDRKAASPDWVHRTNFNIKFSYFPGNIRRKTASISHLTCLPYIPMTW